MLAALEFQPFVPALSHLGALQGWLIPLCFCIRNVNGRPNTKTARDNEHHILMLRQKSARPMGKCKRALKLVNYPLTSVPTFSPVTTRRRLLSLFMSKTIMGKSFSMQSVKAVMSITRRFLFRHSRKVMVSNRVA